MPTLEQLPQAVATNADDHVLIGQNGALHVTDVQTLLAGTQPRLTLAQNTLLGRVGVQPGGPEPVGVGPGLEIRDGQLATDNSFLAPADSPALTGRPTAPTQPIEDDSNAIATTAFVQQHTAQASPVKSVAGRTGYVALQAGDVSGLAAVATSGRYPDLTGVPAADHFNVLNFSGAVADGVTHTADAINAAIAAAAAQPTGGTVFLPAGTWRIDLSRGYLRPQSKVVLAGAGRGRTVVLIDDTGGAGAVPGYGGGISNVVATGTSGGVVQSFGPTVTPLSDFQLRDLTIRGKGDSNPTPGAQLISLVGTNLVVADCESQYSRGFGMVVRASDQVSVHGTRVFRSMADGIALWDVSNAVVTGNIIVAANDDAISAHSSNSMPAPVRSGLVIANNTITESQGIKVLGAKVASITGNVLRRMMAYGIFVSQINNSNQGGTPIVAVKISGNIITDVFRRSEPVPRNGEQYYIRVDGSQKSAGSGASAPGEPAVGTGAVTALTGSGSGAFYVNGTSSTAVASPGGWWVEVTDNLLVRTLPAPGAISDWGYSGQGLWVGNNGDSSGFYNGAIPDSYLATRGIRIGAWLHNALVARNTIQTGCPRAIEFFDLFGGSAIPDGAFQDLAIVENRISDFTEAGIWWPTTALSNQRIRIERNVFDGDPQFRNTNRGAGGTWLSLGTPRAVHMTALSGGYIADNHFRNLSSPIGSPTGTNNVRGNIVHGQPAALGFSTANKGVGYVYPAGDAWRYVIEECDPAAAAYGQIVNETLVQATAMPTVGFYVAGHFVARTDNAVVNGQTQLGWKRLTTGSTHVAGTDWQAVYATSGASLVTGSGNLAELANPSAALATLGGAPLAGPTLTGTPRAPTAAPGSNSTQIATTAFVAASYAAPPAIGATTPAPGSFSTLTVGSSAAPLLFSGGDPNGNLVLGRYGAAITPYMDFRGNNLGSGYSVRLINDSAGQLSVLGASGALTLNVGGTLQATAMSIAGVPAATQSWVGAQGFESLAHKGAANGYAGLDSTGKVPSSQLPNSLVGALSYQGAWNAANNVPPLVSGVGSKGFYYTVAAAGTTVLDGIAQWAVGDHAVFNGSVWEKFQGAPAEVLSVAGRTGVVSLSAADIAGLGPLATQAAGATAITGGSLAGITTLNLANPAGSGPVEGSAYAMTAPAGKARQLFVQTAGSNRWAIGANSSGETGGGAGSDFAIGRYSDDGALLDYPFSIARSTGAVNIGAGALYVGGQRAAVQSWVAAQGYERPANKGLPGGYAGLDGQGRVPIANLPTSLVGALNYQGGWNAANNVPQLASGTGTKGFYYTVAAPGTILLDGISQWNVGDHAAFNGVAWERFEGTAAEVSSVAGRTGAVTLAPADIQGLGSLATQNASAVAVTGGSLAGITSLDLANPNGSGPLEGAAYTISASAGLARQIFVRSGASKRWSFGADGAAESGGNFGTDFAVARYDDAGGWIDNPLAIARATGAVAIGPGGLTIGGDTAATRPWVTSQIPSVPDAPLLSGGGGTLGAVALGGNLSVSGGVLSNATTQAAVLTGNAGGIAIPAGAKALRVQLWGPGGGGGGGGRVGASVAASGGGAGGGGGYSETHVTIGTGAGQIAPGVTLDVTVPAGGLGGAASGASPGNAGSAASGPTQVLFSNGALFTAYGGGGGAGGQQAGSAGGGGGGSPAGLGGTGTGSAGGATSSAGGGTAGGLNVASAASSSTTGGTGGGGGNGSGAAAGGGGASLKAPAGGGAGGGLTTSGATTAFGVGGLALPATGFASSAGAAGPTGQAGASAGGGAGGAASTAGAGGNGGAGGFPGGGGGGGGATNVSIANGGAGGNGGNGLAILTWFF